jgi:hypothetical protein
VKIGFFAVDLGDLLETPESIGAYRDAGVDELYLAPVFATRFSTVSKTTQTIEELAGRSVRLAMPIANRIALERVNDAFAAFDRGEEARMVIAHRAEVCRLDARLRIGSGGESVPGGGDRND